MISSPCWATWGTPTVSSGTCSGSSCSARVPTTSSGDLLYAVALPKNAGLKITGMSGGAAGTLNSGPTAWYHPAGDGRNSAASCAASDSNAGSTDCSYVLVSTAGATAIGFTLSGTSGGGTCFVIEVGYTNGPIQAELPIEADQSASSTPAGVTLWLGGANDFVIQAINGQNSISAVSGGYSITGSGPAVAYLSNTTTATAPNWTESTSGTAAVTGIGFAEYIPISGGLSTRWITFMRSPGDGSTQCFAPSNVQTGRKGLSLSAKFQTESCDGIDTSIQSYNYTGAQIAMRTFNFLYGTVEFKEKLGAEASKGSWPIVMLFDASCQPSAPTGTDDNCNGQEIDIAEYLGSVTSMNQQIHVNNGAHNDACGASVRDASQNYHTVDLIWSAGSLVWKVDGTTTCRIRQSYVPSAPMFLLIYQELGGAAGTIDNSSLPWTFNVSYVKVTQGASVVFSDNFNGANRVGNILTQIQNVQHGGSWWRLEDIPEVWLRRFAGASALARIIHVS